MNKLPDAVLPVATQAPHGYTTEQSSGKASILDFRRSKSAELLSTTGQGGGQYPDREAGTLSPDASLATN